MKGLKMFRCVVMNRQCELDEVLDEDLWFGLMLVDPRDFLRYREPPFWKRIAKALMDHHELLSTFSLRPGDSPTRFVRILSFFSNIMCTMIVNAIIYEVCRLFALKYSLCFIS